MTPADRLVPWMANSTNPRISVGIDTARIRFALLVIVYYMGAELYLIDKSVFNLTAPMAAAIAFGTLLIAWLFYEGLCRSPLARHEVETVRDQPERRPTAKQLGYLRALAERAGQTFAYPRTRQQASAEIRRLRARH